MVQAKHGPKERYRRGKVYKSDLICSVCGERRVIPRLKCQQRKPGHVKTMFCPVCRKVTDFVEQSVYGVIDADVEDKLCNCQS